MKKKLTVMALGVCMVLSMASCGKKDIAAGKWVVSKAYVGETEITQEKLQEAGIGGYALVFEDGKVEITAPNTNEVSEGTYVVEENNVTITSEGEDLEIKGTIEEDQLTIEEEADDMKLIFEKE